MLPPEPDGIAHRLGDQGTPGQFSLRVPWEILGTQSWRYLWRIPLTVILSSQSGEPDFLILGHSMDQEEAET